jgi:aspartyl-tRNA(Asn)/glutamyl-tRNA(Gln) amidotransferase subunit A
MNTIAKVHEALASGSVSVTEITKEFLSRISNSKLNAYIEVCADRALEQARVQDEILRKEKTLPLDRYPLFGVPLGIKDVLTVQGVRTTCASKMLENYIPPYTATSVARLEQAGAITLGKLNMDEFAMGSSNENSAFGAVEHPTHPGRVPGGSSGGSAAAVRAGLCVASLGTDTGGSIRLPASFCGVFGMKPTYGRISRYGLIAFASSLDQIGPFSNCVRDSALLQEVMFGHDPKDSTSSLELKGSLSSACEKKADLKNLKIGVPKEYFIDGIEPSIRKAVEDSLAWFESQGAKLVDISLPHTQYAVATYYVVSASEASSNLARFDGVRFGTRPKEAAGARRLEDFYKSVRSQFGPEVKRRIMLGTYMLSSGYYEAYFLKACKVRTLIKQDFDEAFKKVDLIAAPVAPTTAFERGSKSKDPLQMYLMDIFTIPSSLAGIPCLSIPCGDDVQGLPVGLQLMSAAFQEEKLMSVAAQFERRS